MKLEIKALRVNANLSQKEMAKKMNVTEQTIIKWEQYKTHMKAPQFMNFCNIVGAKPEDVLLVKD